MVDPVVAIEKLAFGGAGFGHSNGKACFVPYTAPGDVVRIGVTAEKRSFISGVVKEFLQSSPMRSTPPCGVFGICGGCQWQHIPYEIQLQQKYEIFSGLLYRIARVDSVLIEPVVPAPAPFGYRSRIQLKVRCAAGQVHLGFYRSGSHFVVDVPQHCAISAPAVNSAISELHSFLPLFPEPDKIPQVDIATGDDGETAAIFHYIGSDSRQACGFIAERRHLLGSANGLWLQSGRKNTLSPITGTGSLKYHVPTGIGDDDSRMLELRYSCGGFSQVNYRQNQILVNSVLEWAELTGIERVLDLYCGNGNISLPMALNAAYVVGVEEYAPSLADAANNCRLHGIRNTDFICSDVEISLKRMISSGEQVDVIVLDPPRAGAKEAVPLIARLKPRAVIYISCDPATLARDVTIMRKHGFDCVKSRPVDMFPQTYHLESVTLLKPM